MTPAQSDISVSIKAFHQLPIDPELALLFPGQGGQKVGMGFGAAQSFATARAVFEIADNVLGTGLSRLCFQGPEEELTRTINAQPALLTTSLAILASAVESGAIDKRPAFVAGHSLGEYTALVAAGSLSFADALRLVRERGRLMEEAATAKPGTMAAIVGLSEDAVGEVCRLSGAEQCNLNARTQTVIGGTHEVVQTACRLAKERGGRGLPMKVAGAFHTSLMESAAREFEAVLEGVNAGRSAMAVIGNVTAKPLDTSADLVSELGRQMAMPVLWHQSIMYMMDAGIRRFMEAGPGQTLITMLKRDYPEVTLISLDQPSVPSAASHV
jgi:[acyl-carrier-protein] S-malonyltransferase